MKPSDWINRWKGKTVACLASGPSLTAEDCETVRAAGLPTIVTNTTFKLCPWADVLFGFDSAWWREYKKEVDEVFKGARLTCSLAGRSFGIDTLHQQDAWFRSFGNSGTAAISLAVVGGASRVLLLGYDCQKTGGKTHWHGDHPKTMGNARSMPTWPRRFKQVSAFAQSKGVPVLNCSRETALACFPRVSLDQALA